MTQRTEQQLRAEAIGWHLRMRDDAPEDWDAFVDWLEADPANSDAFDAVLRAEAATSAETLPPRARPEPANDHEDAESPPGRRWVSRWAAGLGIAAVLLLALVALPMFRSGAPDRYEIATAAGQQRSVDLGDGSTAALNGATRLILDRNDPRSVELAAGEATFSVRHDANRPFAVVSGSHRVEDVGTRFNVISDAGRFEVAVIEGSVLYDPQGARVPLAAGQALAVRGGGQPVLSRDDPARFAGWQSGRLNYASAPLDTVASDLSRSLGTPLRVDPDVRGLAFTGTIRIEGDQGATLSDFAATLGLQARHEGNGWVIEPHVRAPL